MVERTTVRQLDFLLLVNSFHETVLTYVGVSCGSSRILGLAYTCLCEPDESSLSHSMIQSNALCVTLRSQKLEERGLNLRCKL